MWGLGIATLTGMGDIVDPRALPADFNGAVAATGITAVCWAVHRRECRDRERERLIRKLAGTAQAQPKAPTRPLRRVL